MYVKKWNRLVLPFFGNVGSVTGLLILTDKKVVGSGGSRIFLGGGAPTPKVGVLAYFFAENCMKIKEFGPPGRVHRWRSPWIYHVL